MRFREDFERRGSLHQFDLVCPIRRALRRPENKAHEFDDKEFFRLLQAVELGFEVAGPLEGLLSFGLDPRQDGLLAAQFSLHGLVYILISAYIGRTFANTAQQPAKEAGSRLARLHQCPRSTAFYFTRFFRGTRSCGEARSTFNDQFFMLFSSFIYYFPRPISYNIF